MKNLLYHGFFMLYFNKIRRKALYGAIPSLLGLGEAATINACLCFSADGRMVIMML